MKTLFNKKWISALIGILLVAAGILIVVMSIVNPGVIGLIISVSTAVILFVVGGLMILLGATNRSENLFDMDIISGSFIVTIGVLLCIEYNLLPGLFIKVLAIFLMAYGLSLTLKSIILLARNVKQKTLIVIALIVGILAATGGLLFLLFEANVLTVVYITSGVLITLFGGYYIIRLITRKDA
jgi:hypothetical protein